MPYNNCYYNSILALKKSIIDIEQLSNFYSLHRKPLTCCKTENDCVSKIIISPDSLAIIRYETMLELLVFRRIVSMATIVGSRSSSLSAFLAMKSFFQNKNAYKLIWNWSRLSKFEYSTCCSSSGNESSFCDIRVSSLRRIVFKFFTSSGICPDFSNGSCAQKNPK